MLLLLDIIIIYHHYILLLHYYYVQVRKDGRLFSIVTIYLATIYTDIVGFFLGHFILVLIYIIIFN